MIKLLAVGLGGFFGAISRYWLSEIVSRRIGSAFPYGTLAVNFIGCLCIGVIMSLVEEHQMFSPHTRLFILIGILGSLTTFSTFGHETVELLRAGDIRLTILNIAANIVLCVIAVLLGRAGVTLLKD